MNITASLLICASLLLSITPDAQARIPRSSSAVKEFKRHHPCPATGATRGKCAGWEVDHVIPLCAGGPDTPANMQWLSIPSHRQKTKVDVMRCRLKNQEKPAYSLEQW